MKNIFILIAILMSGQLIAQTSLSGKIMEDDSGVGAVLANVALYKGKDLVTGVQTDFDGFYNFSNIDAGTYDVEASYVGYATQRIEGVVVFGSKANKLDIQLGDAGIDLSEIVVKEYKVALIEQDNTTSGATLTSEQLRKLPTRNARGMRARIAGISSKKKRRKRKADNVHIINDIRIQGSLVPEKKPFFQKIFKKNPKRIAEKIRNSDNYGKFIENDYIAVERENTSTFSIDVDKASYAMVRRNLIQSKQMPPKDAVRIEEMINYFNYDYEQPKGNEPFSIYSATARSPWNPENILVHIGIHGKELDMKDAAPSNLVFLIDVSGSMSSANKLQLLKPAFKLLVDKLRPEDRVAIVVYAGSAGLVLPSTPGNDKKTINEAIDRLQSGGSTAGGAGIKLAYQTTSENFIENGNNRVILATDGDFNVGISDTKGLEELIVEKRKEGVYLTTLGFGHGNYQDAKMETLADKGNGNYAYIDNLDEAKKVFITELTGTLYTIAKDVKIQIEFDKELVENYRLIGYENRLLANEDFHDDTKDAGELGAGHTVTALYELKMKTDSPEEILKLKLRYKLPKEDQSRYIETFTTGEGPSFETASENLQFAASVAGFGMLLRGSKYSGDLTFAKVESMASAAKGDDKNGYRKELLELIEIAKQLEEAPAK